MGWTVVLHPEVREWLAGLADKDRHQVLAALKELQTSGPTLGRPWVDTLAHSRHRNMKELRPRGTTIRLLFAFGPQRCAVVLVAGDKKHQWIRWYESSIPLADTRFDEHLDLLHQRGEQHDNNDATN